MKKSTRKATHTGHCQVCGRKQKLPNGRLSLHGYVVRWSCFLGTCSGTDHSPFEKSIDMIKGAINFANQDIERTQNERDAQEANTGPLWYGKYIKATWERGNRQSSVKWIEVKFVTVGEREHNLLDAKTDEVVADSRECGMHSFYSEKDLRPSRKAHLGARLRDLREYVAWQEERIKGWVPTELAPVGS